MSDKTVASLPDAATLTGAELFYVVQNGTDRKTTVDVLRTQAKGDKGDKGDTGETGDITPELQALADAAEASAAEAIVAADAVTGYTDKIAYTNIGRVPAVDTGVTNTQLWWVLPACDRKGLIREVHVCSAAGSGTYSYVTVCVATVTAGVATRVEGTRKVYRVPSGVSVISNVDIPIEIGQYPVVRGALGLKQTSGLGSGQQTWYTANEDLTSLTQTTGIRPEAGVVVDGEVTASARRTDRGLSDNTEFRMGRDTTDIVAGTAWTSTNWIFPNGMEAPCGGVLTEFEAYGSSAGILSVGVFERWTTSGTQYAQTIGTYSESVASGTATIMPNLSFERGQFLGFRHTGTLHYSSTGGQGASFAASIPATDPAGSALTAASPTQTIFPVCGGTFSGGAKGDIVALQARVTALEGGSANAWTGKKIGVLGSSISALGNWTNAFQTLLGCTLQNLGVSGASLGQAGSGGTGGLGIYNQIASLDAGCAAVILECGTNDFGAGNVTLGSVGDTTTATYYGALHKAFTDIYARCTNAHVFVTVPYSAPYTSGASQPNSHLTVRSDGKMLKDFQEANRIMARWFGVRIIDWDTDSGVNYYSASDTMTDNLHPNATYGGVWLAQTAQAEFQHMTPRP